MLRKRLTSQAKNGMASVLGMTVLLCVMAGYSLNAQDTGDQPKPNQPEPLEPKTSPNITITPRSGKAVAPRPDIGPKQAPEVTDTKSPGDAQPAIVFPEPNHDFGEVWVGTTLTHTFTVRNEGQATLKLLNVKPSCGCTVAKEYDKEIAPGQTGKIPITVNSARLKGKFNKTVSVTSNDPVGSKATLRILGSVKHYIDVQPRTSLNLGSARMSEEKSDTLKLVNNSDRPLKLTLEQPATPGAFKAELTETVPGQEYQLKVKASPPYKEGMNRASISVKSNIPEEPVVKVSAFVRVTPRIEIRPRELPLTRSLPRETTKSLRLINHGDAPVKLLESSINDEKLTISTASQKGGKEYVVTVTVPADYVPPQRGKSILLKLDDSEKPTITVPIRGPRPSPAQLVGKPAPVVEFTTHKGATINTAQLKDQALVLFFYATWCPHCRRSLPQMEEVHKEFKDRGVRFVAVNLDNPNDRNPKRRFTTEQALEKLDAGGVTFDVAFDGSKRVGTPFMANRFPTTFVLGKNGRVVDHISGAIAGPNVQRLRDVVQKAVKPMPDTKAVSEAAQDRSSSGT